MLTAIEIESFECFQKLVLPLRPLTLLSGRNASGKSTVLQALQSMRDRNKRTVFLLWMTKDGPFWEEELKQCVGDDDGLNAEGLEIQQNHFVGDKAWFTDSSDGEKREFKNELTFPHPERPGETLFCTWHGKVKTPQMRVHFAYPLKRNEPLYVVYIGPKITKR